MINFTCVFVINLLDFIILKKYFFCFSRERFSTKYIQKLIWILCVSLLSLINLVGNPNLNLIFTCIIIVIYSLTYRSFAISSIINSFIYRDWYSHRTNRSFADKVFGWCLFSVCGILFINFSL